MNPVQCRPRTPVKKIAKAMKRTVGATCFESAPKHVILAGVIARLLVLKISIACNPHARAYMDRALAPVGDDNDATLDLLTKTAGASTAIAHIRKVAELTRASRVY